MTNGWKDIPLGKVLTERRETPSSESIETGEVSVISKIGFKEGQIELRHEAQTKTGMILIRPGDLVISGINAAKGAIAIYSETEKKPIAATIHYGAYIPDKMQVDIQYLWWFLRSAVFKEIVEHHIPGGIKTELKAKRFLAVPVPLPPLTEQRRIVTRIEALAARVTAAQSLRREASDEARALLDSFARHEFSNNSWAMISIDELVGRENLKNGKSLKSDEQPSLVSCLRISALRNGIIDCSDVKPINMTIDEAKPYTVEIDDVFIVRGNGSKDLVGRAGIIKSYENVVIFPDLFIKVPLNKARILPEFFVVWWNSPIMRDRIIDLAKTTSGIWKVNQGHIASCFVPMPLLPEQQRIVAYLDGLQAQVTSLRAAQAESERELAALMPSVLDRAFKGAL